MRLFLTCHPGTEQQGRTRVLYSWLHLWWWQRHWMRATWPCSRVGTGCPGASEACSAWQDKAHLSTAAPGPGQWVEQAELEGGTDTAAGCSGTDPV